jgi:hypothetical protein
MKRISKDKWTDGEHIYEGNPKDGFTKVGNDDLKDEIIAKIKERDNIVEMEAHNLQQPKKEVDTESEE